MRHPVFAFALVVALVITLAATPAAAGGDVDDGRIPVWWSPALALESFDKVQSRLARSTGPAGSGAVNLEKTASGERVLSADANSCSDLFALQAQGYGVPRSSSEAARFTRARTICEALRWLATARPARRSFVRDLRLDRDALSWLPAFALPVVSCARICQQYFADEQGLSLAHYLTGSPATIGATAERLRFVYLGIDTELVILARADVIGDGYEELLIENSAKYLGGSYAGSKLLVLTRHRADGVLRVVAPHTQLCGPQYYQCHIESNLRGAFPTND